MSLKLSQRRRGSTVNYINHDFIMKNTKIFLLTLSLLGASALLLPAQGLGQPDRSGQPPQGQWKPGGSGGAQQDKQRKEHRQEMLERFDKDGDGKLSEEEREAAKAFMRERAMERASEHFDELDTDGNGSLSREEFMAGVKQRMEKRREEMKQKRDRKEDRRDHRQELKAQFDKDGDGKLDQSEREALREHLKTKRGGQ